MNEEDPERGEEEEEGLFVGGVTVPAIDQTASDLTPFQLQVQVTIFTPRATWAAGMRRAGA